MSTSQTPDEQPIPDWTEDGSIIAAVIQAMREADPIFETTGGGTRHYVRELLLPIMQKMGLIVAYADKLSQKAAPSENWISQKGPKPGVPDEYELQYSENIRFVTVKDAIGKIMWDHLCFNEAGTAVEANPATHRIAEMMYKYITVQDGLIRGIEEGAEQWKADYENLKTEVEAKKAAPDYIDKSVAIAVGKDGHGNVQVVWGDNETIYKLSRRLDDARKAAPGMRWIDAEDWPNKINEEFFLRYFTDDGWVKLTGFWDKDEHLFYAVEKDYGMTYLFADQYPNLQYLEESPSTPQAEGPKKDEIKRRGLKAFDESMRKTFEAIEPEDSPFEGSKEEEQPEGKLLPLGDLLKCPDLSPTEVPEEPAFEGALPEEIEEWIGNASVKVFGLHTPKNAYFRDGAAMMYHKMQEEIDCVRSEILGYKQVYKAAMEERRAVEASISSITSERDALHQQLKEDLAWKAVAQTSIGKLEERIEALACERDAYLKALIRLKMSFSARLAHSELIPVRDLHDSICEILAGYPSPTNTDKP